jgi:hypothetical protein
MFSVGFCLARLVWYVPLEEVVEVQASVSAKEGFKENNKLHLIYLYVSTSLANWLTSFAQRASLIQRVVSKKDQYEE